MFSLALMISGKARYRLVDSSAADYRWAVDVLMTRSKRPKSADTIAEPC